MFTKRLYSKFAALLTALALFCGPAVPVHSAESISIVIDGRKVQTTPQPVIKNDRTLVPVRLVSEALGAQVEWREESRTVHITKGDRQAVLRIDNRLVDFTQSQTSYSLCDVPPQILEDRTFVPLRLVSNVLGVAIQWDDATRTVSINSGQVTLFAPFFDVAIASLQNGQTITGATQLQLAPGGTLPAGATEVRYYLLDPLTGRGTVVARGNSITAAYLWLPDPAITGQRVLAAGLYNKDGQFLAGNALLVNMAVIPQVSLNGAANGQVVGDTLSLSPSLNFLAEYVKYEITNQKTGKVFTTEEADPQGVYQWTPQLSDNGSVSLRIHAYDKAGNAYSSAPVSITIGVARQAQLRGITSSYTGEKPVTLWFSRNYLVSEVEYLLKNVQTGSTQSLRPAAGSLSYWWFPAPEQAGTWEVSARIKDTTGAYQTTEPVSFTLRGLPLLLMETIGPNQIITGSVKLRSLPNVPLSKIEYYLINPKTGAKRLIAAGNDQGADYPWTPGPADEGYWQIQAVGTPVAGGNISSEAIPVRVYLGKLYESKPIIEKSKFQDFVSAFASQSQTRTGMSAALQAAQAILETGWGQSTPVDKYTGKMSNNLFGIKGSGPAGSVTSNTWEEYNGATFRVDADFRAYQNPEQSWNDHKSLLLNGSRYAPFRSVMHDSTLGAWALKRCGYATDSKYPLKLMDIIKRYGLYKLDEVGI